MKKELKELFKIRKNVVKKFFFSFIKNKKIKTRKKIKFNK